MQTEEIRKPLFPTAGGRVSWTMTRIAYVRHCAEAIGMTAREIAADIGLEDGSEPRIFALCKRERIKLRGIGPKRAPRGLLVDVAPAFVAVFGELSRKHGRPPKEIARLVLEAAAGEGATFCENLLDFD